MRDELQLKRPARSFWRAARETARSPARFTNDKNPASGLGRRIDRANESDLTYVTCPDRAQFVDTAPEHHTVEKDMSWQRGAEIDACQKESRA